MRSLITESLYKQILNNICLHPWVFEYRWFGHKELIDARRCNRTQSPGKHLNIQICSVAIDLILSGVTFQPRSTLKCAIMNSRSSAFPVELHQRSKFLPAESKFLQKFLQVSKANFFATSPLHLLSPLISSATWRFERHFPVHSEVQLFISRACLLEANCEQIELVLWWKTPLRPTESN